MTANMLNLPQCRVLKVDETEHGYHIYNEIADATASASACTSGRNAFGVTSADVPFKNHYRDWRENA